MNTEDWIIQVNYRLVKTIQLLYQYFSTEVDSNLEEKLNDK